MRWVKRFWALCWGLLFRDFKLLAQDALPEKARRTVIPAMCPTARPCNS